MLDPVLEIALSHQVKALEEYVKENNRLFENFEKAIKEESYEAV